VPSADRRQCLDEINQCLMRSSALRSASPTPFCQTYGIESKKRKSTGCSHLSICCWKSPFIRVVPLLTPASPTMPVPRVRPRRRPHRQPDNDQPGQDHCGAAGQVQRPRRRRPAGRGGHPDGPNADGGGGGWSGGGPLLRPRPRPLVAHADAPLHDVPPGAPPVGPRPGLWFMGVNTTTLFRGLYVLPQHRFRKRAIFARLCFLAEAVPIHVA